MNIAIVHDYLMQIGGAERVLRALLQLYPKAICHIPVFNHRLLRSQFAGVEVVPSFLQHLAHAYTYKLLLGLYPIAIEAYDFRHYDVVLSSSSSFAKGAITTPDTIHINYCHTPARFVWRYHDYINEQEIAFPLRFLARCLIGRLRNWDYIAAQRVDYFIANSHNVARRIQKYYHRASTVIYPPVDVERFHPNESAIGNYYLVVSRLLGYKRVDLAIEACNRLKAPLLVIGEGPDLRRLSRLAGPKTKFIGYATDSEVARAMAHCRALLLPGEEDFGITPLEAMASGRPVIAFGRGGSVETVFPGLTGIHFYEQTVESLVASLHEFEKMDFDPKRLRSWAEQFDISEFKCKIHRFVEGHLTPVAAKPAIGDGKEQ